ncbi:MAG: non-heme iron oxygenase ferredoxin subunit [Chloroflexi bacterium]|nr:non-heme iron oxygenase ferredoxin subunit [Chloroflexota bacterium]
MADFVKVATVDEIPPGEMKVVELGGEEIAVANVDGQFFAFGNSCPHRGGPLGEGLLVGEAVECPWHGSQFSVKTGEVVTPPANEGVPTFEVQVEGSDVKVAKP